MDPQFYTFDNGGTIIEHILSMFKPALEMVMVIVRHAQIVWETILL